MAARWLTHQQAGDALGSGPAGSGGARSRAMRAGLWCWCPMNRAFVRGGLPFKRAFNHPFNRPDKRLRPPS